MINSKSNSKFTMICKCTDCGAAMVKRKSTVNNGFFMGCSNFGITGCKVNQSLSTGIISGQSGKVAKASKNHGPVISMRSFLITQLVAKLGASLKEAEEFYASEGLESVRAFLAA